MKRHVVYTGGAANATIIATACLKLYRTTAAHLRGSFFLFLTRPNVRASCRAALCGKRLFLTVSTTSLPPLRFTVGLLNSRPPRSDARFRPFLDKYTGKYTEPARCFFVVVLLF